MSYSNSVHAIEQLILYFTHSERERWGRGGLSTHTNTHTHTQRDVIGLQWALETVLMDYGEKERENRDAIQAHTHTHVRNT